MLRKTAEIVGVSCEWQSFKVELYEEKRKGPKYTQHILHLLIPPTKIPAYMSTSIGPIG